MEDQYAAGLFHAVSHRFLVPRKQGSQVDNLSIHTHLVHRLPGPMHTHTVRDDGHVGPRAVDFCPPDLYSVILRGHRTVEGAVEVLMLKVHYRVWIFERSTEQSFRVVWRCRVHNL